jgi:two-component system, response regulator
VSYPDEVDVLLVEDNACDAELTMRALSKRRFGKRVFAVEDGVAALDFIFGRGKYVGREAAHPPMVVLLDLKLPRVDGLEVLKALKADKRSRCIPVVILTSSREAQDVDRAYAIGANSYVVKPVAFDAFVEALGCVAYYWLAVNQPWGRQG